MDKKLTNRQAIGVLDGLWSNPLFGEAHRQAFEIGIKAIKALEQQPCEDEYIKVPKKALKYRTAGMVAYNAEWLKNNFDIERAVICGAQAPCDNAVSRQAVLDLVVANHKELNGVSVIMYSPLCKDIKQLPPVNPQPKWIPVSVRLPEEETDVLICNGNGDIEISRGSYSSEVENDFIWYTSGWRFGKVIAWMPLTQIPKPYQAESGVNEWEHN